VSGASLNTGEQEDWRDVYIYRKKSFFSVCEDATEAKRNSNSCQAEQKKKKLLLPPEHCQSQARCSEGLRPT